MGFFKIFHPRHNLDLIVTLALLLLPSASLFADEQQKIAYMGTGSCSSSNCHGSVSPRNATHVLQNEYTTWQKHDLHAQAWLNLTNQDSKRIGHHLGIEFPEKEPLCLKCHSTYLSSDERRGTNYVAEDGVSCESCHGAAEKYLGPHTASDATIAHNIDLGMTDLRSLDKRANLCLSCHVGNDDKAVTHRLIGAGHPRLSFELDTYSQIEPQHWSVDDDYKKRKGDYSAARAWLIGQIERADQMSAALLSEKRSKHGIFPELTAFYCYSCHHSLSSEQWKVREYGGNPGELQLNVSSPVIVSEAFALLDKGLAAKLDEKLKAMHASYREGKKEDVHSVRKILAEAKKKAESAELNSQQVTTLLRKLIKYGAESGALQYEVAEQVAMGMSALSSDLGNQSGKSDLYKAQLDQIYASLKDPKDFKAEDFTAACEAFQL